MNRRVPDPHPPDTSGRPSRRLSLQRDTAGTGGLRLSVSGPLDRDAFTDFLAEWQALLPDIDAGRPERIAVDLAPVSTADSAGALLLMQMETDLKQRAIAVDFLHASGDIEAMFALLREQSARTHAGPVRTDGGNLLVRVGDAGVRAHQEFVVLMTFFGEMIAALADACRHPRSVRWGDVLVSVQRAGLEGLPIVGLISFLLGLIIAFMSSLQLKPLGAGVYVAALVGISVVKELGPIMTAIVVAGRSGSAFAAEIGTMKVNEEVDALVIMGFDPMKFIALPKILAAVIVLPLLTLYADLFAILGGLVVGVLGLDMTAQTYIHQTLQGILVTDISTSLLKAVVFAVLIAGISCQRGFLVTGAAEAVGRQTTSAVVSSLFLVIIADSAFAIALHYIR
jgi:phospholipid/cholesterol/gamma-HCH transport system permease protein